MKLPSLAANTARALLDFLFPPECPVCGRTFEVQEIVCHDCLAYLTDCAAKFPPDKRCLEHVDSVSVLLPYTAECRKLIHGLKYHGIQSVGIVLGKLMAEKTLENCDIGDNPYLLPIPLHPSKMNERGYNQSERIAEGFSQVDGFDIHTDLVVRRKATSTQTALSHTERAANVSGAFAYTGSAPLDGKPIVLIDDVLTTGSTVSECAAILKDCGAGNITVCVAATPDIGSD